MNNRIKFAYHLHGWKFDPLKKTELKQKAQKILPEEYQSEMEGSIYCPECCSPLYRSPKKKAQSESGRKAFFAHAKSSKAPCGLRSKQAEGKKYLSEELALKAVQSEELVVVAGFIDKAPVAPEVISGEYDQSKVEDINGPVVHAPIGRHRGDNFALPSKFKTIRSITRNFDENIYRYFYMPNGRYAVQLQDLLVDIKSVRDTDDTPRLYFGKIKRSYNAGKKPSNIRMTILDYDSSKSEFTDFCFKLSDLEQKEKGIDDDAKGRFLIVYGKVTESGTGLCIKGAKWGEFALLPRKYEYLL